MQARDIPNLLTIGRIILIVPIVMLLLNRLFEEAMALFLIAGISDGLDGLLAKRFGWQSRLGAILDPLADKLLLVSAFFACTYIGIIPWWLTLAILLRDIMIVLGALYYDKKVESIEMAPSIVSKMNTFLQILCVLLVILYQIKPIFPEAWLTTLFYIVFTTTCISGADYLWTWGLKVWRHAK